MTQPGFSHVGLSTLDMDATLEFYENVLSFPALQGRVEEGTS